MSVSQSPTPSLAQQLITLRHANTSWKLCAELLGKPVKELRDLSIRLRDADEWRLPNRRRARNASTIGQSGKPLGRPRVDSVSVNVRLPLDVAAALREVAEYNELRLGEVIAAALVPTKLLNFKRRRVSLGPPKQNVNARISAEVHASYVQRHGVEPVGTAIAAACKQLLRDLGCEMVKP